MLAASSGGSKEKRNEPRQVPVEVECSGGAAWNGEWKSAVVADQPPATATPATIVAVRIRSVTGKDLRPSNVTL